MKNILLIHGFNGIPKIFNYLKNELERIGYNVIVPIFPVREEITVEKYYDVLDNYKEIFNENLIVIAHSIGNPIFAKYISKNNFKIDTYISLAGFCEGFYNEGQEVLNEKVKLITLADIEKNDIKKLVSKRYSIYSNNDHVVPFNLLENYCKEIDSESILIENIGHMGNKSGLEELPIVVEIIEKY